MLTLSQGMKYLNGTWLVRISGKRKQALVKPLSYFADRYQIRNERLIQACWSEHDMLAQGSKYFGVSDATVNRLVKQTERREKECQR